MCSTRRVPDERGALSLRFLIIVLSGAVLLLGLIVLLRIGGGRRAGPPAPPATPKPLASVALTAPSRDVAVPPREFSWAPVPGAVRYRVKISDEDALWPMFVRMTDHPPLVLEPREASALTPGRIYVWEVEALGKDDAPIATGAIRFRITPPAGPS